MRRRRLGLLASAAGLSLVAAWLLAPRPPNPLGGRPDDDLAAAPAETGPDPFGYWAAFDAELRKVGPITPAQFAARYPAPAYSPGPAWDPTPARFFDRLSIEKVVKPGATVQLNGRPYQYPPTELPGYKLDPAELAAYRRNGFVVSERLGGYSFGQVYYDVYARDLPVFVTSDSVLHAWRRSYDAMLEELERTYLLHALDALLAGMHDALPGGQARYGSGPLRDAVLDADYFLAVARSLLADGAVPSKLGQDGRGHPGGG